MQSSSSIFAGPKIENARAAIVLVHGRGADSQGMIDLYAELAVAWCAAIAPQAPGHTWYPHSFLAPLEANQPYLDHSLAQLKSVVDDLIARNMPVNKIILLGFSQGACLCSEFAARNPRTYGAIIALTGGLIGPPGTPRNYPGTLAGTPVFLGTSDPDPHVPFARVQETKEVFATMGATVEFRRYPGMGHTINEDELTVARQLVHRFAPT